MKKMSELTYYSSDGTYESYIKDGWFTEQWDCYGMKFKVVEILHHEETPYQTILIVKTTDFGNVLLLDGITQCTDRDEFIYQEMIAHIPLYSHPDPQQVLIIGGGDGGVLREVLKHPGVKTVTLCEIDERVIEVSRKYLPNMSVSLDDPKVRIVLDDGNAFVKKHMNEFDVIITDSSDPVGPNKVLFQHDYYESIKSSLKDNGIMCCQGGSIWLDLGDILNVMNICRKIFAVVRYSLLYLPTYPGGQIGMLIASKCESTVFEKPLREVSEEDILKYDLRYYSSKIHETSFMLPRFVKQLLNAETS